MKNTPASPAKLDAPAPPSPEAGRVHLTVTGAVQRELTAEGPRCEDERHVSILAHGRGTEPWRLTISDAYLGREVSGEERMVPADLRLSFGDVTYVWTGDLVEQGTVTFQKGRIDIDASATRWNGPEVVRVKGFVTWPDTKVAPAIDPRVFQLLWQVSRREVRRYSTYEFGRQQDARALSVVVPEERAEALVAELRSRLGPGWSAWRGTGRFVDEEDDYGVEVVVGAGHSPVDVLRQAHVDPINYDLITQDVVDKVSAWHRAYGVDVLHADAETVELRFETLPDDVGALAQEMYELCSDVVGECYDSMEALVEELRIHRRVRLWWD